MKHGKAANTSFWILQVILAGLFLFAGVMKLSMPGDTLADMTGLPTFFMRFVSLAEVAGGLGLVLPGLVRLHRELTPMAALGLALVMIGAVVVSALRISVAAAVMPFVVGVLLLMVARARRGWRVDPETLRTTHG